MRVRYFDDKAVDPPKKESKVLRAPIGNCTICGQKTTLPYQCPRCHKGACDERFCRENIKQVKQCKASV